MLVEEVISYLPDGRPDVVGDDLPALAHEGLEFLPSPIDGSIMCMAFKGEAQGPGDGIGHAHQMAKELAAVEGTTSGACRPKSAPGAG